MPYSILPDPTPDDLADFQSLKGKQGHLDKGIFIAEGPKIVRLVLESDLEVESAFLTPSYFERFAPLLETRTAGTETRVMLAPKSRMEEVIGYHLHQGAMLAVRVPENPDVHGTLETWRREDASGTRHRTIVALDSIADAENMGAIIRNAAAFGVDALLIDDRCCDPYLRRSVRVSMGTIVGVTIMRVPDLAGSLRELRTKWQADIIGAALTASSVPLLEVKLEDSRLTVIVFGSEGWGVRQEVAEACDVLAEIPIASGVDSLNVAIANGIFLYHLQCLRTARPHADA